MQDEGCKPITSVFNLQHPNGKRITNNKQQETEPSLSSSRHILIIRFSAMGDVAMTVPVIKNALEQNPELEVTVVSNTFFEPLFAPMERCHFHPAYLTTKHKGIAGIFRLFKELTSQNKFDAVADFHNVLRSKLLSVFFKLAGYKTAVIDKGREEKKALTRKDNKILQPLTTSFQRYAKVLKELNIDVTLSYDKPVYSKQPLPSSLQNTFNRDKKAIGVAPFAQHKEKMYPVERMKMIVQNLAADHNIILFGGGAEEKAVLQQWTEEIPGIINAAGNYSFSEEMAIISNLDAMISMDSANMHLASLFNVPVISIWAATHPYAGFYGWNQNENNIVSVDLPCRPCSVFGNKPCWRGDHACMMQIEENMITAKLKSVL